MPRLVVIGGSSISTPGLALALRGLKNVDELDLVLHGRTQEKLESVARACQIALRDTHATISWHTDLDTALTGAELILIQVRVGGLHRRHFDESFPRQLGLLGEETLGAGGFSNALRTIPVVLDLAQAIARVAPNAKAVNLTNPASLVLQALARYSEIQSIAVCDVPVQLTRMVYRLLKSVPGSLEIAYYGTNHIGWITSVRAREDGVERLPDVLDRLERAPDYPIDNEWVKVLGVLPGSYLRYFYSLEQWLGSPEEKTRAAELLEVQDSMLRRYSALTPEASLADLQDIVESRQPHWYQEIVVPVLSASLSRDPQHLIIQTMNHGQDPRLPQLQAIEIPARVSSRGVFPETPAPLPPDCRSLLEQNAVYESLAVEGIVERDRSKVLRALVTNPFVGTVEKAEAVLNAVWS